MVTTLATAEGEETFDTSFLGYAAEIYEEAVGDNDYIFIHGFKNAKVVTILLRGANEFMTEEIERFLFYHHKIYYLLRFKIHLYLFLCQ